MRCANVKLTKRNGLNIWRIRAAACLPLTDASQLRAGTLPTRLKDRRHTLAFTALKAKSAPCCRLQAYLVAWLQASPNAGWRSRIDNELDRANFLGINGRGFAPELDYANYVRRRDNQIMDVRINATKHITREEWYLRGHAFSLHTAGRQKFLKSPCSQYGRHPLLSSSHHL